MNQSDRPIRVLQIIETGGPGGAETVFANLSSALRDGGHYVHCMVGNGTWLPSELRARGLSTELLESQRAVDFVLLKTIRAAIQRERIDVVHAHLFDGAVYATLAARLEGRRALTTLHGQVDIPKVGIRSWVKRRMLAANSTFVTTVSEALRRDVSNVLRIRPAKLIVVHNGVQPPTIETDLGLPADNQAVVDSKRIVAVGNIRVPKNYPLLLEAFALVRQELTQATLHIVGQQDRHGLYEVLQARAEQPDLAGSVVFHGFVPNPQEIVRRASAFVLASTQEGFSLATIEAMLVGVPVVATRSGGPEEIVRDGETGLLVPVNDARALATSIVRLLKDRNFARTLAAAAQSDARTRFGIDAMVANFLGLYREAMT